jgi:hypothetical protein
LVCGTELLSRAVKETISEADYAPANAVASVTLSGPRPGEEPGRERILNLLEGKLDNAQSTMNNNVTKAVYGDGTVAKSFAGLKAFITDTGLGTSAASMPRPGPSGRTSSSRSPAPPACSIPPSRPGSTRCG